MHARRVTCRATGTRPPVPTMTSDPTEGSNEDRSSDTLEARERLDQFDDDTHAQGIPSGTGSQRRSCVAGRSCLYGTPGCAP